LLKAEDFARSAKKSFGHKSIAKLLKIASKRLFARSAEKKIQHYRGPWP
jgi:hypothetical protein